MAANGRRSPVNEVHKRGAYTIFDNGEEFISYAMDAVAKAGEAEISRKSVVVDRKEVLDDYTGVLHLAKPKRGQFGEFRIELIPLDPDSSPIPKTARNAAGMSLMNFEVGYRRPDGKISWMDFEDYDEKSPENFQWTRVKSAKIDKFVLQAVRKLGNITRIWI